MSVSMCPTCGEPIEQGDAQPGDVDGDNFCPNCHEPLFWRPARLAAPALELDDAAMSVARPASQGADGRFPYERLPEKLGIEATSYGECWNCEERHDELVRDASITCRVCAATIPKPKEHVPPLTAELSCMTEDGQRAQKSWEVPDPVLVVLGVLLVGLLTTLMIVQFVSS